MISMTIRLGRDSLGSGPGESRDTVPDPSVRNFESKDHQKAYLNSIKIFELVLELPGAILVIFLDL